MGAISPTRIREAKQCLRKWAFKNVYGESGTGGNREALAFGTKYHSAVEHWLKSAKLPEEGTLVYTLLMAAVNSGHLPPPLDPNSKVEYPVTLGGINGTLDLFDGKLKDHKTSGSVRWVPTPEAMTQEIQANFYGLACMNEFDLDVLECIWLYMMKDTGICIPVEFQLTREGAQSVWEETAEVRGEMMKIIDNPPQNPLELEGAEWELLAILSNPLNLEPAELKIELRGAFCNAFGGCPYRDKCFGTLQQENNMTSPLDNILAKMNEEKGEGEVALNPPPKKKTTKKKVTKKKETRTTSFPKDISTVELELNVLPPEEQELLNAFYVIKEFLCK